MRIVFYSTNSNAFDENNMIYTTIPSYETQWENFKTSHSEHEFLVVTQKPGMFLPHTNETIYVDSDNTSEIAAKIIELKPDVVIAASFWTVPFDWLPIKDALVAEELHASGIKVICHSVETTSICFDKWETHHFLEQNGFNCAKGVLVKHDLYFCAGNQKDVKTNVYKEAILNQIKKLKFPVVIKDNVGLSSYGMSVAHTFGEVTNYLNSKKNNSDRIVEEYIDGEQYGSEIYGIPQNYSVLPPFKFSLNQYGITSPKLSKKNGPFYEHFEDLQTTLLRLSNLLHFSGAAQVDLVLHKGKWFIIEINPRLSGMTMTYSAATGLSVYEMLYRTCIENNLIPITLNAIQNSKTELCNQEQLKVLASKAIFVCQTENRAAKQEREKGYCEIICLNTDTSESN